MIDLWMSRTTGIFFLFATISGFVFLSNERNCWAGQLDVFAVHNIKVDVTADSTAIARDRALAIGERLAFRELLERLTIRDDHPRLPAFNANEISAFIADFEVAEEKASKVRYLATLNYSFKAEDVRSFLKDQKIAFAETTSKPVLVLPVYQAAGSLLLWDDPNPWRAAWKNRHNKFSLVPTILPKGDLQDIATIGPEQTVAGDEQRLSAIAERYKAGDTVVALAIMKLDRGRPDLEVYVTRYGSVLQEQTVVKSFASNDREDLDNLLSRASLELTSHIEDNWKRDNILQFGRQAVLAIKIKIRSLKDWLEVRSKLADVAVVRRSDLVILSLDEARVNLHYIGEPAQLALALEQADLKITRDGDSWELEAKK